MTRLALFVALWPLGCSAVLDPDGLVFPENDATDPADTTGDAMVPPIDTVDSAESTSAPDSPSPVEETESPIEDTAEPIEDTAEPIEDTAEPEDDSDAALPAPVIRVNGGTSACEVAYRIAPALPLVDPCAKTCTPKGDGWRVELTYTGAGSAAAQWSVEATQGIVPTPASGTGASLSTVLTFGEDNCGSSDAVPDFTLLVSVKVGGATTKANFDFDTTLDGGCPAITCE